MPRSALSRWLSPLGAGLVFMAFLLAELGLNMLMPRGGISDFINMALGRPAPRLFGILLFVREIIPLYMSVAFIAWILAFAVGCLLGSDWRKHWGTRDGFAVALSALAWIHVWLWWKVPTALWDLPLLGHLPFWLVFPLIAVLALLPALGALSSYAPGWRKGVGVFAAWVFLWTGLAELPFWLAHRPAPVTQAGLRPAKVLTVAIDGLREDVAHKTGLQGFKGLDFPNVYSPLPATRLLYHLLWGSEPAYISVGAVMPGIEEFDGTHLPELLVRAQAKGMKVRVFFDDGGTIGLAGRGFLFDAVRMPAPGWENFVNSNLAGRFPLYASWLDFLRIFPSTTPWADSSLGLRRTLEEGRGADWVMFHSCLAHQPIYLNRQELGLIGAPWWRHAAKDFQPYGSWRSVSDKELWQWRPERSPEVAYRIRMKSILEAWAPLWNELSHDPQYGQATRVFFSDHGERFYHLATTDIQLGGAHGFDLDPWELRVPLKVAGPGFPDQGQGTSAAVSLLDLRDALANSLDGRPIGPEAFGTAPFAPSRFHALDSEWLRPTHRNFKQYSPKGIIEGTQILADGVWVMKYEKPTSERQKDVCLALAQGSRLTVFKPLVEGGAVRLDYDGYQWLQTQDVDEATFKQAKELVESQFLRPVPK